MKIQLKLEDKYLVESLRLHSEEGGINPEWLGKLSPRAKALNQSEIRHVKVKEE